MQRACFKTVAAEKLALKSSDHRFVAIDNKIIILAYCHYKLKSLQFVFQKVCDYTAVLLKIISVVHSKPTIILGKSIYILEESYENKPSSVESKSCIG